MEPVTVDIKKLKGFLPMPKKAISLKEMEDAIKKENEPVHRNSSKQKS